MKKGFTLLEVVICIMILCILIIPLYGLSSMAVNTNCMTIAKDEEFNIARGVCEKFISEKGLTANNTLVIYTSSIEDLPYNITDTINSCIYVGNIEYDFLLRNNIDNKKYAIILNGSTYDSISLMCVKAISMRYRNSEVELKIAH
jgi:prepilin-type N-terminal cleavage/methylation domain-containing protein